MRKYLLVLSYSTNHIQFMSVLLLITDDVIKCLELQVEH